MGWMINTNGEVVTHCPTCGVSWDEHRWVVKNLKPSFTGLHLTSGGPFLLPECLEWPGVIDDCPPEPARE